MALAEVTAGLTALGAIKNTAVGLLAIRDLTLLGEVKTELLSRIMDAQAAMTGLQATISDQRDDIDLLKAELSVLRKKADERARYALIEIRPGAFAYALRSDAHPPEPAHYACQGCLDTKGTRSILESFNAHLHGPQYVCPSCERRIDMETSYKPPPIVYGSGGVV